MGGTRRASGARFVRGHRVKLFGTYRCAALYWLSVYPTTARGVCVRVRGSSTKRAYLCMLADLRYLIYIGATYKAHAPEHGYINEPGWVYLLTDYGRKLAAHYGSK